MQIFQVTNRKTHARAVIVARSERAACEHRPDNAHWRDGRWVVYDHGPMTFRAAPELPCWPVTPEHVCAQVLATSVVSLFDVEAVIAFDRDETPRQRGEGPDHWWNDDD